MRDVGLAIILAGLLFAPACSSPTGEATSRIGTPPASDPQRTEGSTQPPQRAASARSDARAGAVAAAAQDAPSSATTTDNDTAMRLTRIEAKLDAVLQMLHDAQAPRAEAPRERRYPAMDMVGRPAPAYALQTVHGIPVGRTELANYPATVLNFVAPNCGFCKRQIPQIETLRQEYEPLGILFVNVSETMGKLVPAEEALRTYQAMGSRLDVAFDDGNTVGRQFKVNGYPTLVVLDAAGKVQAVNIGAKADIAQTLRQQLDALVK